MIAKLGSPLGSPTLAATNLTAQLRNRLPTQLRRCLPLYAACVIFVLIVFNLGIFHGHPATSRAAKLLTPPFRSTSARPNVPISIQPRAEFPPKIWQIWKIHPLAFEARDHDVAISWVDRNPDWRYEVLTDANAMRYVEYHFGPEGFDRPDIVDFYRDVKAAIVKADLLRYLVMYAEGGVYADIDVEALKPMHKFVPDRYNMKDIDMVIGVEIDEPDWKDHPILGPKSRSFCQWTFMCKPQLPVMMRLIEQIMDWLSAVAKEQQVPIGEVELDFDEIISGTGPSAFTNAIIAEMNAVREGGREIDWDVFHDLSESKVVNRVLVLTVEAFAAGQGHSDSGNHEARAALVRHHYHASNWPSRHPRFKHPAYGEIEQCNWNDECINTWDKNVAEFKTKSSDDQQRIIAEKEKEREKKEAEEKAKKEEEERRKKEDEENERKEKERKKKEDEAKKKEDEEREAAEEKQTSLKEKLFGKKQKPEPTEENAAPPP